MMIKKIMPQIIKSPFSPVVSKSGGLLHVDRSYKCYMRCGRILRQAIPDNESEQKEALEKLTAEAKLHVSNCNNCRSI